jgi:hypothetical protein
MAPLQNEQYFVPPEATPTLLRARGFGEDGQRSGGIDAPQIVELPAGTICSVCITTPRLDAEAARAFSTPLWLCATTGSLTPVPAEYYVRQY